VGKGDRRTRRGKIYNGSFGKSRPKDPGSKTRVAAKSAAPAAAPARGKRWSRAVGGRDAADL